jgi:DNA-binding PadR family transcriptional regulator
MADDSLPLPNLLQKSSAEIIVLSLLEERARHGYEIAALIEQRSGGQIAFRTPSLYPLLYRLESRELVEGRWVEKPDERRKRFYRLTPKGRRALAVQRQGWNSLVDALIRIGALRHA